jgi:hypothetical protein
MKLVFWYFGDMMNCITKIPYYRFTKVPFYTKRYDKIRLTKGNDAFD